jgi:hypothetical protein
MPPPTITTFLASYDPSIQQRAHLLRAFLRAHLPNITEQVDLPAKMIAYTYGQKYFDLICVIIPSKKGLKLGFNRGTALDDPNHLLQGTGKISRYVEIKTDAMIDDPALKRLMVDALSIYHHSLH